MNAARRHLIQNYRQQPIVLARGEGSVLWDVKGDRYLDMTAGIAVCCLGHSHPKLTAAISAQASKLVHASNLYYLEAQVLLAQALVSRSFAQRAFFCNSGAEANEAALKLARRYQQVVAKAPDRVTFIATEGSFHGRTLATVAVTGQEKYRLNFGPLPGPVRFISYGNLDAAREALQDSRACAIILEPIQAEGGIIVPPPGYLKGLRELCTRTGTLLIFDEVQTGVGRTGSWFGYEHEGSAPDIMTLAKGLAGGVPIGAMLATDEVARGFLPSEGEPATHASTFGGNPLACAAAITVIDVIESEGLLENCREASKYLWRGLHHFVEKYPGLAREARGRGLLLGLNVHRDAAAIVTRCREKRLLVSLAGGSTIRFVPALHVARQEIDEALEILDQVLTERTEMINDSTRA
ncbi:MAG: aspartate aminotransferase family protein [Deltaproteobacteria bacterium]|nr:aspartate aminotransferase family protein [Deltaproteobacteria bacterium]